MFYYSSDVQPQPSSAAQLAYAASAVSTNNSYNSHTFSTSSNFTQLIPANSELVCSPDSSYFSNYSNPSLHLYSQPGINEYSNILTPQSLQMNSNYSNMLTKSNKQNSVVYNNNLINDTLDDLQEDKENVAKSLTILGNFSTNNNKSVFCKIDSPFLSDNGKEKKLQPVKKSPSSTLSNLNSTENTLKDFAYYERRKKNNAAAKQSRSKRRERENILKDRVEILEGENNRLKNEVLELRQLINKLSGNLNNSYQKQS